MEREHHPEFSAQLQETKPETPVELSSYETEIGTVEVKSKLFLPAEQNESQEFDEESSIIFLPGYGVEADYASVKELNQSFSNEGSQAVYSLSTRTEKVYEDIQSISKMDSLYYEAEAVVKFIKDKGLKKITLAGYSQGGAKAMDVARIIQENHPDIDISNGLILMDSTAVHTQTSSELKANFFRDAKATPINEKSSRAGLDIVFTALKEAVKSNTDFFNRINRDTEAMAPISDSAEKLRIPVVLIQGEKDMVSDINKIIPDEEAMNKDRESYLKANLFINSPYVRMVVGKKESEHGMPTYRSEQVAKAALYMLDRYKRERKE